MRSTELAAPDRTNNESGGALRWIARLLSCIRLPEVLALQGSPLVGATLAIGSLSTHGVVALAALAVGSFCLVAHVFLLNDWAGIHEDLRAAHRATRAFTSMGVTRPEIGYLSLAFLAASLTLIGCLGLTPLGLAAAIAVLSSLYSIPRLGIKGIPVVNTLLHLIGGSLHFLLGYATFAPIDPRGLAISCFFGMVFAAGHLMQETRDFDGDLLNGIRTNAVAFGKTWSFAAGLVLFSAANALLLLLALQGAVPRIVALAAVLYPLHLRASLTALRAGLTFASLQHLQKQYWLIYALIGILLVAASL